MVKLFKLPFRENIIKGDSYEMPCRTLVLHGAGKSDRTRFTRMRQALQQKKIPSLSFDFIGHGETGGELLGGTLRSRTEQVIAIIDAYCQEPLTLIAASMSAYTAVRLTEVFSVRNLILLVPAFYTFTAYDTPFGPFFSEVIRAPFSWRESDAFQILERFRGNLLVIAAERDQVIPGELVQRIYFCANQTNNRQLMMIPGSGHNSLFPKKENFTSALEAIVSFCRSDNPTTGLS